MALLDPWAPTAGSRPRPKRASADGSQNRMSGGSFGQDAASALETVPGGAGTGCVRAS